MKTATLFFFILSVALFLSTPPKILVTAYSNPPVYDTSGKELRTESVYDIRPVIEPTNGGGVTESETDPRKVVQKVDHVFGRLVRFSTLEPADGVIRTLTDLNIRFYNSNTVWRVGQDIHSLVWADGVPHQLIETNWFQIEQCDGGYKIWFCPNMPGRIISCGYLGIVIDSDGTRLFMKGSFPLIVKFERKAD